MLLRRHNHSNSDNMKTDMVRASVVQECCDHSLSKYRVTEVLRGKSKPWYSRESCNHRDKMPPVPSSISVSDDMDHFVVIIYLHILFHVTLFSYFVLLLYFSHPTLEIYTSRFRRRDVSTSNSTPDSLLFLGRCTSRPPLSKGSSPLGTLQGSFLIETPRLYVIIHNPICIYIQNYT